VNNVSQCSSDQEPFLAHRLNNMLSVVLGRLELAAELAPPDSVLARHIAIARESAKRMASDIETYQLHSC
jgi:signal transduction histidine kinase